MKLFSQFFTAFLKSTFNFEHCRQKDEPHSLYICKVIDGKKRRYVNV